MANTYTIEQHTQIHDDDRGHYILIRPDRDGLGLCEIIHKEGEEQRLCMTWDMARLMANMILNLAEPKEHPKA